MWSAMGTVLGIQLEDGRLLSFLEQANCEWSLAAVGAG
jgi:hypothetical protein